MLIENSKSNKFASNKTVQSFFQHLSLHCFIILNNSKLSLFLFKGSGDGLSNICKESLFYGVLPLCLLAVSGWIAFFIYYKKRRRMPVGIGDDSVNQQNQELRVITNYYDEINDGEISNQSRAQNSATEYSLSVSDRSENSITSTNNDRVELTDLTYINPYQQLIANVPNNSHKYASLTRSHHYFVVIDSHISHLSNPKRHTY